MAATTSKIPIQAYIKIFTDHDIPVSKALLVTGRIYKTCNTVSALSQLTDAKLKSGGIEEKSDRKLILDAVESAGYCTKIEAKSSPKKSNSSPGSGPQGSLSNKGSNELSSFGPSTPVIGAIEIVTTPSPKKKRKRQADINEFIPQDNLEDSESYGSLEFNETIDEQNLKGKFTVINRAPLMTAWATVVAERQGFRREEALSIASVYTEMNAISKGVSIGVFDQRRKKETEDSRSAGQPYVDIMGRSALFQTQSSQWRALANNNPALPSIAFSYICRSMRQTTPYVMGALRLLAASYAPDELNKKGFGLYAELRPDVNGWGERGEVRCDKILELRGWGGNGISGPPLSVVKIEDQGGSNAAHGGDDDEKRESKKARSLSLDEYEAALDEDATLNDLDLSFLS